MEDGFIVLLYIFEQTLSKILYKMGTIPKLKIKVNGFRAIHSADITLDGITVIAGINGCGKSTISKLLYQTIKTAIDYDKYVINNLSSELKDVRRFMEELIHELSYSVRKNRKSIKIEVSKDDLDVRFLLRKLFIFNDNTDLKEQENKILAGIDYLKKVFNDLPLEFKKEDVFKIRLYRLERYFKEEFFQNEKEFKSINTVVLLEKLKTKIKKSFQEVYNTIENRPIEILDNSISDFFTEDDINVNNFNIEELGALITNRKLKKLSNFLTIDKVAYIDTPMIVGVDGIGNLNVAHWEDLDFLLKNKKCKIEKNKKINLLLKNDVIEGETIYDDKNDVFVYKRNDGFTNDLFSCATGLKSFSILQILYNNGYLDSKTLLIIDEPETHLHPEWIVQYARLIVLLHKEHKVNFLIGSHNPDMVMALKYIAKKELGTESNAINFYNAVKFNPFDYDYHNSKDSIEDIFDSFNISIEKIKDYSKPSKKSK